MIQRLVTQWMTVVTTAFYRLMNGFHVGDIEAKTQDIPRSRSVFKSRVVCMECETDRWTHLNDACPHFLVCHSLCQSLHLTANLHRVNWGLSIVVVFFFTGSTSSLGPGLIFSSMIILQTVGLLGQVISSSQGLYLNTGQHKTKTKQQTPWLVVRKRTGSGTGSTQPREDNWGATWMKK
jgi:hypothetical protein